MASSTTVSTSVVDGVRSLGWGTTDPRVRATWRVLLAWPLLWILTGGVLTATLQATVDWIPSGGATGAGLTQSLLHAGFLVVVLVAWARYLDRRPLTGYGIRPSLQWMREFGVGLLAVLGGFGVWLAVTSVLGGTTVSVAPSLPDGSVLFGLLVPFVALGLHAAVQQLVFFRVILTNAAEGLSARGVSAARAGLGAIPVAILFFVAMHGSSAPLRIVDLAVAGAVFALLSLQTGSLAAGIGAHTGALYGGIVVSALLEVTGSLSGVLGTIDAYGFPRIVLAYVAVLAWLWWSRGTLGVQPAMARWRSE